MSSFGSAQRPAFRAPIHPDTLAALGSRARSTNRTDWFILSSGSGSSPGGPHRRPGRTLALGCGSGAPVQLASGRTGRHLSLPDGCRPELRQPQSPDTPSGPLLRLPHADGKMEGAPTHAITRVSCPAMLRSSRPRRPNTGDVLGSSSPWSSRTRTRTAGPRARRERPCWLSAYSRRSRRVTSRALIRRSLPCRSVNATSMRPPCAEWPMRISRDSDAEWWGSAGMRAIASWNTVAASSNGTPMLREVGGGLDGIPLEGRSIAGFACFIPSFGDAVHRARQHSLYGPRENLRARPFAALQCSLRSDDGVRLPQYVVSRGSITRRSRSLSTLRKVGHPNPTQDSLPAGGRLRRAGLSPAGSPQQVSGTHYLIPFPQASLGATSASSPCSAAR
jgi:hypothetical protein